MNGFKTSPLNRKRNQRISRAARKLVMNRLSSVLKSDIEDSISCDRTEKSSTDDCQVITTTPSQYDTVNLDNFESENQVVVSSSSVRVKKTVLKKS